MFIVALLIIVKNWKQSKYSSMCEWLNKLWYSHDIENYSANINEQLLIHTAPWMNLQRILLSAKVNVKRSHTV